MAYEGRAGILTCQKDDFTQRSSNSFACAAFAFIFLIYHHYRHKTNKNIFCQCKQEIKYRLTPTTYTVGFHNSCCITFQRLLPFYTLHFQIYILQLNFNTYTFIYTYTSPILLVVILSLSFTLIAASKGVVIEDVMVDTVGHVVSKREIPTFVVIVVYG